MEEKKTNYKYSWVASLVGAIFMIGYFILFMVTIIDINSQEYFYGDGVTIDYNVLMGLMVALLFLTAVFLLIHSYCALKNKEGANTWAIVSLVTIFSTIIVFSVFIALYGVLMGAYFVYYMIVVIAVSFLIIYEMSQNRKVKEAGEKNSYDSLNEKIAQLDKLKQNGLIDDKQYEELKKNYISKFLLEEQKK